MEPRLILFDIDGTLVDLAGAGRAALLVAFREVFAVKADGEAIRHVAFAGKTDPVIVRELAAALEIDPARLDARSAELEQAYLVALDAGLRRPEPRRRVLPGVGPLLDRLHAEPAIHLGLVTGNLEGGARRKLATFDLNRFFPGGGFGGDAPDRRGVARAALRRMRELCGIDFERGRVTVVGDTADDVDCAHANGFRAVAVRTGWAAPGTLEAARPEILVDDLTDSAILDALVDSDPRSAL